MDKSLLVKQFEEDLIFNFNGGLFKIQANLLTMISLLDINDDNNIVTDLNHNPIVIKDLNEFKNIIKDTYKKAINKYKNLLLESNQ